MIIIQEVVRVTGLDGKNRLRCLTDHDYDGSTWECDPDGTNWTKTEIGIDDLQESLNKHLNETKTN